MKTINTANVLHQKYILTDTRTVAKPATNIHIPLTESEAVSLLLRVKPTKDMPRPGASKSKAKSKRTKKTTAR